MGPLSAQASVALRTVPAARSQEAGMGDNQTRNQTVTGGAVIDQWTTVASGSLFEITVESAQSDGCQVAVDVANSTSSGVEVFTFCQIDPAQPLPSGPHRTVVAGEIGGTVVLRAVPLSDSDPGSCQVTYTFKWAG